MKDRTILQAGQHHPMFEHHRLRERRRVGIASILAATLAVLAFVSPPRATAQSGWNAEQDSCSSLYPIPTPNYFNGTLESPPNGWGSPMTDPSTGAEQHWSWDGLHPIVGCNTLGLYAQYAASPGQNKSESRSHSTVVSGGYGAAFQCVELIQRYAYAHWKDLPSAWKNPDPNKPSNASNHYFNHPSHLTQHDNGTSYLPVAGDIVVFGPVDSSGNPTPDASAGHIAIIAEVNTAAGTVKIFEQNWGGAAHGWHAFHNLRFKVVSGVYTIGNDVTESVAFPQGPGGKVYRWQPDHVIYGVLSDSNGSGSSADPQGPTGTASCTTARGPFLTSYCDAPSVNITCGGAIGSQNDLSGIPINWTNTNGNTACVTATYSFGYTDSRQTCSFYLYAPNGFATTTIKATLSDGSQPWFDENPVSGWQHWFDATGITSLTFSDGNGTTNQKLGWGRTASWSIERICSL